MWINKSQLKGPLLPFLRTFNHIHSRDGSRTSTRWLSNLWQTFISRVWCIFSQSWSSWCVTVCVNAVLSRSSWQMIHSCCSYISVSGLMRQFYSFWDKHSDGLHHSCQLEVSERFCSLGWHFKGRCKLAPPSRLLAPSASWGSSAQDGTVCLSVGSVYVHAWGAEEQQQIQRVWQQKQQMSLRGTEGIFF